MKRYFLNRKTNESESHSLTDLQILGLQESDFVWFEGLDAWEPVGDIEELKPHIRAETTQFSKSDAEIITQFKKQKQRQTWILLVLVLIWAFIVLTIFEDVNLIVRLIISGVPVFGMVLLFKFLHPDWKTGSVPIVNT